VVGDHDAGDARYRAVIRARMRRDPGTRAWTSLKNGFTGLMLSVGNDSLIVYAPGLPVRLARWFGVDYELSASDVSLSRAHMGWLGTPLFVRDCIVLTWTDARGLTELAVRPEGGDLDRLESALVAAGAQQSKAA